MIFKWKRLINCRFFRKRFPVCFNHFVIFLVTPYLLKNDKFSEGNSEGNSFNGTNLLLLNIPYLPYNYEQLHTLLANIDISFNVISIMETRLEIGQKALNKVWKLSNGAAIWQKIMKVFVVIYVTFVYILNVIKQKL